MSKRDAHSYFSFSIFPIHPRTYYPLITFLFASLFIPLPSTFASYLSPREGFFSPFSLSFLPSYSEPKLINTRLHESFLLLFGSRIGSKNTGFEGGRRKMSRVNECWDLKKREDWTKQIRTQRLKAVETNDFRQERNESKKCGKEKMTQQSNWKGHKRWKW